MSAMNQSPTFRDAYILIDSLTAIFEDLPAMPTGAQLAEFLAKPLAVQLPLNYAIPQEINDLYPYFQEVPAISPVFNDVTGIIAGVLGDRDIFYTGLSQPTENDYIPLWDSLIRSPLFTLSHKYVKEVDLEFRRDSTDKHRTASISNNTRPDFLCWMGGALILRGEEKRSPEQLDQAFEELGNKMGDWSKLFYGDLPFVFAYATGGSKIQ